MGISIVKDLRTEKMANALRRIPEQFAKEEVMMKVFRKASKPLLDETKSNLSARPINTSSYSHSYDHRRIAQSMQKHVSARKSRSGQVMRVGVVAKDVGKLGYLLDAGSDERKTFDGRNTGKMPATHFWRDAISSSQREVEAAIDKQTIIEVDKYVKKNMP